MNEYHKLIADKIPEMSNDTLFGEYLDTYLGDGEDNYHSVSNLELLTLLGTELSKRLMDIGFLKQPI